MKKLIILALFLLFGIDASLQAKDLYIKLDLFPNRKAKIYDEIVSYSGLAKSPSDAINDNYHLTLAQIKDGMGSRKSKELKAFLLSKLNKACQGRVNRENAFILKDVYAGRYTVNRSYNNCPIALFPDYQTFKILKEYNLVINKALAEFNWKNRTNFVMSNDLIPSKFTPHITLAHTNWINTICRYDRGEIIKTLNKRIEKAKQRNPKRTYDFMLIVPKK